MASDGSLQRIDVEDQGRRRQVMENSRLRQSLHRRCGLCRREPADCVSAGVEGLSTREVAAVVGISERM